MSLTQLMQIFDPRFSRTNASSGSTQPTNLHNPRNLANSFSENRIKANRGKCHLITSISEDVQIYVEIYLDSKCEILLVFKIDY